ncbi:MAG: fumarylacetoacetate hydrolase family protein [Oscillospiraceae bacterium]|nr:fumarylacetoacetate hydrolase family protein [Oscillospiraceae bacterium]
MKLCNLIIDGECRLGLVTARGVIDASGTGLSMDAVIAGADRAALEALAADGNAPTVEKPVFGNVVDTPGKLICVGLNYREHAMRAGLPISPVPSLFCKFPDALAPDGAAVTLPDWEDSYDYEAELVIVIGREAFGVSEEKAAAHIFGYTCGNDLSCRDAQKRTTQWLIGKTLPGFGPAGPWIVTADAFDPEQPHAIRSYVNGELRQDGDVTDMIFHCAKIVSYASHYMTLRPGDLIFTGTPSGVALEGGHSKNPWLKAGDTVDVEIEGIGTLRSVMA